MSENQLDSHAQQAYADWRKSIVERLIATREVEFTAHLEDIHKANPDVDWHLLGMEASSRELKELILRDVMSTAGSPYHLAFKAREMPDGLAFLVKIYPAGDPIPRAFLEA